MFEHFPLLAGPRQGGERGAMPWDGTFGEKK